MRELIRKLFGFQPDLAPNEFILVVDADRPSIRFKYIQKVVDSDSWYFLHLVLETGSINMSYEMREQWAARRAQKK